MAAYRLTLIINIAVFVAAAIILIIISLRIISYIRHTMAESVAVANELSKGNVNMTIEADETLASKNEFEALKHAFAELIENSQKQAKEIENIASGNFSIMPSIRSDNDAVNISLLKMLNTMKELESALLELTEQYEQGNTYYHIDASVFQGGFKGIMDGINNVMDVYGTQTTELIKGIARLGEGQLPEVDTNRPGNYGEAFKRLVNIEF